MEITVADAGIDFVGFAPLVCWWDKLSRLSAFSDGFTTGRNACPTADSFCLLWRQNDKLQPFIDQQTKHIVVTGGLRQPHRFRFTLEPVTKIGDTPTHLSAPVAFVTQRQDRVVVSVGDGVAMAVMLEHALRVGGQNAFISLPMISLEPRKQGWSKIKTDLRIVVYYSRVAGFRINYPDRAVRLVTFGVDALVPIMKRQRARFSIHLAGPGVLAWRLIKMAVDD